MFKLRRSAISKFTAMLSDASVVYRTTEQDGEILVIVDSATGPSNIGIEGMSTIFTFDARSGALICIGAWGAVGEGSSRAS